jgi:hypothetical protein
MAAFNQIRGLELFERRLKEAGGEMTKACGVGLFAVANNIMGESKNIVPVDFGTLKRSGYVALPQSEGNDVVVELGYGGPAQSYAVQVHEDTAAKHAHGQCFYLEEPLAKAKASFSEQVHAVAERAFKNKSTTPQPIHPKTPHEG